MGRGIDGHEKRTSAITTTVSSTDTPGHGNFIVSVSGNWLTTPNGNLWQGINGINNPCPVGFRLPTEAEMAAEFAAFSFQNEAGAFASPLKLTLAF